MNVQVDHVARKRSYGESPGCRFFSFKTWIVKTTLRNDLSKELMLGNCCLNDLLEVEVPILGMLDITPPKTNMEPENEPLEKEIPIGNHHFQVPC